MKQLFLLFFLSYFLVSCTNENDATSVILFTDSATQQTAEGGKKLLYEITTYSIKSNISKFQITSFDVEHGEKMLLDTVLNVQKFQHPFIYNVPEFSEDSVLVKLQMTATDFENNKQEFNCSVTVVRGTAFLPELTGIVLYSGASERPNAFFLSDPSNVFRKSLADSARIDVFDYTNVDLYTDKLSREWRTNTDIRFSRVNSLNYALITAQSLKNIYASVIRQKYITDIQANDIILLGREDKVVGVLQIVNIADEEDTQNDYYRFNIKVILDKP